MTNASKLFRPAALDRLSSPEQLDRLVTLTRPAAWLALIAICGLSAITIIWGIVGTIPTRVEGDGILIGSGGRILDAAGSASGTLAAFTVRIDDVVKRGQIVARLEQTDTARNLSDARQVLAEREQNLLQLRTDSEKDRAVRERSFTEQEIAQRQAITAARERSDYLQQSVDGIAALVKSGDVTRVRLDQARKEKASVDQQVAQAQADLAKIGADRQALISQQDRDQMQAEQQVNDAKRVADNLAGDLERSTQVLSPADGRVTELKVAEGAVVTLGEPVLSIETAGTGLQLIAFIPPSKGKMVQAGMEVRIAPSTVHKEEFGTLVGRVHDISEFPATAQGMAAVLHNERLIDQFSKEGPPYATRVTLLPDPASVSGYRWSSGSGPPLLLRSGTLAKVEVTVREQPPLSLVIPFLRNITGIAQ
jgi:HlyD family secretion protein